jgi:hypothetical protein
VLEACLAGEHRMLFGEDGLAVMRVQAALIDLGRSVGPKGADGIFGNDTGAAVSAYKVDKALQPSDPVVGPGTAQALDDDFFFDPPTLDPTFTEFSPAVVEHRLEPFVALVLAALIGAPLTSWRHMLGLFALNNLNSRGLLGIVARSRIEDLRAPFLAIAAPTQRGGVGAEAFFNAAATPDDSLGVTIPFDAQDGSRRSLIIIKDGVILGREAIVRTSTGARAAVTLQGVVVHELTHARNLANADLLLTTQDTDATVYADTALAQARSATGAQTVQVLRSFVEEICARHVHWVVLKEDAGDPNAPQFLPPDKLAEVTRFYFEEVSQIFDSNGYVAGINAQGQAQAFHQMDLWLQRCAAYSFTDDPAEEARTQALFRDAAAVCANNALNPPLDFPEADGLFPRPADFVL